ncbi:MAG TPA: hypothetical protein VGG19_12755, partial [Tepidisphaeraceae bacterium]
MSRFLRKRKGLFRAVAASRLEQLERRTLLSTITWTGNAHDNQWTTGTNWQGNVAPGSNDEALINIAGSGITFNNSSSTSFVGSIVTDQNISIAAGTLSVGTSSSPGSVQLNSASISINGGTLQYAAVSGSGFIVLTNNGGSLDTITAAVNIDGTSTTSNPYVHILNNLTLDNSVLEIGGSSTSFYGYVYLGTPGAAAANIQVTSGATGEIRFGASNNNDVIDDSNLTTSNGNVTLVSSGNAPLTIDGTGGNFYQEYQVDNTFTNQGTINANSGGTITLDDAWINNGTMEATNGNLVIDDVTNNSGANLTANGANAALTIGVASSSVPDSWSNSGTITLDSGTINFGGSFNLSDLGTFNRSGGTAGTVNLTGTMNGNGGTLTLDPTTIGSWNLLGGDIQNTTLVENSTAQLIFTNSGGTLDNVTADENLNVWSNSSNAFVHIYNTLTLDNAVLEIGGSSTSYYGYIYLGTPGIAAANIQVTNGTTGEIKFGAASGNDLIDDSNLTTSNGNVTFVSSVNAPLTID